MQNDRLPPGQFLTERFPVLHAGNVPKIDLSHWDFRIRGLVDKEVVLTWEEFSALPQHRVECDIHCVTTWSRYDNTWDGVRFTDVMNLVNVGDEAKFVMIHAEEGWSTNLPITELLHDQVLFAHHHQGKPLTPDHGWPLRLVVPHLYFWKSAKWVRGIEFMKEDRAGFWEERGYHMLGDPWLGGGQRFRDDPAWFGTGETTESYYESSMKQRAREEGEKK